MTDEEFIKTVTANAQTTAAVAVLLRHLFVALSQQPNIDKELLIKHFAALPAPAGEDAFAVIYSKLKEMIVQDIQE